MDRTWAASVDAHVHMVRPAEARVVTDRRDLRAGVHMLTDLDSPRAQVRQIVGVPVVALEVERPAEGPVNALSGTCLRAVTREPDDRARDRRDDGCPGAAEVVVSGVARET